MESGQLCGGAIDATDQFLQCRFAGRHRLLPLHSIFAVKPCLWRRVLSSGQSQGEWDNNTINLKSPQGNQGLAAVPGHSANRFVASLPREWNNGSGCWLGCYYNTVAIRRKWNSIGDSRLLTSDGSRTEFILVETHTQATSDCAWSRCKPHMSGLKGCPQRRGAALWRTAASLRVQWPPLR